MGRIMKVNLPVRLGALVFAGLLLSSRSAPATEATVGSIDPYASNNGFLPDSNKYPDIHPRVLSKDYPTQKPANSWADVRPKGEITVATAADYMSKLKAYVEPTLRKMIEAPDAWSPAENGWYDMPWMAASDPTCSFLAAADGREAILGSYSGQVILSSTFAHGQLKVDTQNHTVIYYDPVAALTLGNVWADPNKPKFTEVKYGEGALVVKAGAIAVSPEDWPAVKGASVWKVFRPTVADLKKGNDACSAKKSYPALQPVVTEASVVQFDIIVKDSQAAPKTGWVFTTFVYDAAKDKPDISQWDRLVPLGAIWGNDPEFDQFSCGRDDKGTPLAQTWINKDAPSFIRDTLGWGERMSGPIDLAVRHGVEFSCPSTPISPGSQQVPKIALAKRHGLDASCSSLPLPLHVAQQIAAFTPQPMSALTTDEIQQAIGTDRVSSCLSCHGTAQTGSGANLYPSCQPNFPADGETFKLYQPGSREWSNWFQNRPGHEPQQKVAPVGAEARVGLDYDMLFMFAIGTAQRANGIQTLIPRRIAVH
jgi:hypothetical protein